MRYEVQTYDTPRGHRDGDRIFGVDLDLGCKARPLVHYILWVAAGM
jgi:hypothetical protein